MGSERAINSSALDEIIDVWWPKLEEQLKCIPKETTPPPARGVPDQLEELLILAREQLRRENLRLEASKERDEKSEQLIQLMERAGLAMNHLDGNAKAIQGIAGKLNGIVGEITSDSSSLPLELQSQLKNQMLNMFAATTPISDMKKMAEMMRDMHERDKIRTADMLTPTDVSGTDSKKISPTIGRPT